MVQDMNFPEPEKYLPLQRFHIACVHGILQSVTINIFGYRNIVKPRFPV